MIGMRLRQAQAGFFDRERILAATTTAERKVLSRFGAFVRQGARSSIRTRKAPAPPGQPPSSHTGLLKRNIFFAFDRAHGGVVIGPVTLNQKEGMAPRLLEHGGTIVRRRSGRTVTNRYAPRPFMRPAFTRELASLPPLWRDSIR